MCFRVVDVQNHIRRKVYIKSIIMQTIFIIIVRQKKDAHWRITREPLVRVDGAYIFSLSKSVPITHAHAYAP